MRIMTLRATLPHGLVFEHEIAGLFLMAFRAILIQPCKSKPTRGGWFEDVASVWIMAVHTIQLPLHHRMMVREAELRMNFLVTLQAGIRTSTRIVDEHPFAPAGFDMETAGTVTGLASGLS